MDWAKHFRDARQEFGLTQAELATQSGVSIEELAAIEEGRKQATMRQVVAICSEIGAAYHAQRDAAGVVRPEPIAQPPHQRRRRGGWQHG